MWIINCILLIIGTVAAVMGISFYWRNKEAEGRMRTYICSMGIFSALWCISFGIMGITENLALCDNIRIVGIISLTAFLISELYLISDVSRARKSLVKIVRVYSLVLSFVDIIIFARPGLDEFIRVDGRTTWLANSGYEFNRGVHSFYIAVMFLNLLIFGLIWLKRNKVKRLRHFLVLAFVANFAMLFFSIPDTFLPTLGYYATATSGIGAAVCAIVMWYGATQLSSFDIRMGSIKDKVFDFIDAGVVVFDLSGSIALLNRYAEERIQRAGIVGRTLDDLFVLNGVTAEEMFKGSEDNIYMARLWNKDNTRAYSVRINGVKDNFDEVFCYMCVFIDVSEEVEAIKKFEIASEAKSRFLAQMSHEIRTPINAVLGMNEMILREEKNETILDYSRNIDSAGKTLLTLINSILDFSKIEDGKMEIQPVRYDTASMVNDLINSVIQRADAKGLIFEANIDEALPCTLFGDDVRFSQVIMNLLTNAVKYTQEGSVTFTMSLEKKEADIATIYVAVKDTGIGIREEDREALFESFERLDEIRNHNIEGTGLGLSIIKSLLSLMDSSLTVESVYGKGSCFSFTINQRIADETPIGDYKKRLKESYENRSEQKIIKAPGAKLLVVDDNDMNLKVCANLLKLFDIKPDLVTSGAETIEKMREDTYDIVLLDHMMPKMDGIETLKRLKDENLIPSETIVIALTANAVVGAREMYLEAGFDDYLSKPIAVKELGEILVRYLPEDIIAEKDYTAPLKKEKAEGAADKEDFGDNDDEEQFLEFEPEEEFEEFYPQGEFEEFYPTEDKGNNKIKDYEALLSYLKENGIDIDEGIGFAAGDKEFYLEIVSDYCKAYPKRAEDLQRLYEASDMKEYEVLIHAVKSNSKSIGATGLWQLAAELEEAASENRRDFVDKEHPVFMKLYKETVELIADRAI